jgi:uncharacterized protein YhaN
MHRVERQAGLPAYYLHERALNSLMGMEARKAIHDRELRAGDWKALNDRIDELSHRLDEIKSLRSAKAATRARLSRGKRVAPLLQLIDRDRARLAALEPMPVVPIGFSNILREKLETVRRLTEARQRIADDEVGTRRNLAEIIVDVALLPRASDVLRLFGETGAYASNRRDLPRIQAETDEFRGYLVEYAGRLGLHDESAIDAVQPTDAAQALVRALVLEGRNLMDVVDRNAAALATERTGLSDLEQQRERHGVVVNPQPVREKFASLAAVIRNMQERSEMDSAIRTEARSLREAAGRSDPPVNDLDSLANTAVPSLETITRFRKEIETVTQEMQREKDRSAAASDAAATAESKLLELASSGPVPSAEIVAAKRQQRDADWWLLRGALFASSQALSVGRLAEVVASFERYSSEADQLADQAASDAKRVAAHAVETRRLSDERAKEADIKNRLTVLEKEHQEVLSSWTAAWKPAGIAPLHPSEMVSWRLALEGLFGRREKLEALRHKLAAIDVAITNAEPVLRMLAAEVGLSKDEKTDIAFLPPRIADRLQAMNASWDQTRNLDSRISDTQQRIGKLIAIEAEAERSLQDWSARWALAVPAISMPAATTLEEAVAALDIWNKVPSTIRERNNRARRVAGMQRNVENFERDAKAILTDIAPDLATLPLDAAVKVLNDRLAAARAADTRRTEIERRAIELVHAREAAEAALAQAGEALTALTSKIFTGADLPDLVQRLTERDNLLEALQERQGQLIAQSDGNEEDKLRVEFADFNSDEIESELAVLDGEEQALEREAQEVFAEHAQAIRERAGAEQGIGAEVAAQQRSSAEAELLAAAREWLLLKFGSLLIGTAISRHRATQHGPLMARAGILFDTLTGGSFAGVGQDYNEHDTPRLVGRRSTGEMVAIPAMSTGARDQLYLALRLAYLEDYAIRADPPPFIGDDLFATFDEDRTANGLAALAAIGDRIQPIVFTHHHHLVEIAQTRCDADVLVL